STPPSAGSPSSPTRRARCSASSSRPRNLPRGPAMEIPRPSEDDKAYFRSLLPEEAEVKPMFGNLGAFVNGNMYAGLFGSAVGVKLAGPDAAELVRGRGHRPYGPAERPMGGYLSLPPGMDR